ncbi:MAG TPA: 5-oxoprolinase subunit PxpA [Isosphaeraceae bacterium]|nr:5-oxoprolinase subunit PxpA [Isosphaeraceae bacterium]
MNDSEARTTAGSQQVDLNADLGEGCPNDRALLGLVTSTSVCCGAHAGSPEVMRQTLRMACARGVVIGAHPGYPDREGFGRREQDISAEDCRRLIIEQVGVLEALAAELGAPIRFLKPHGALYNQAQRQPGIASGVVAAAAELRLPLLGQPGTLLERLAIEQGVGYIAEGFPDRRYRADGSLVPRSEPNAILHDRDEREAQLLRLVAEGRVATLCIHGDDPRAVANAELVRDVLGRHGIVIRSFLDTAG